MMEGMTLTEFLLACIDDDKAAALAIRPGAYEDAISASRHGGSDHVDRWSPARVLVDCEAKRRIIELHRHRECDAYERTWGDSTFGCEICHEFDGIVTAGGWCGTLKFLALPYADRPEYREEWRP